MLILACAPSPEKSCNFVQSSQKQRVSWPISGLTIGVHQNVLDQNPDFLDDTIAAAEVWNQHLLSTSYGKRIFGKVIVVDDVQAKSVNVLIKWNSTWDRKLMDEQAKTLLRFKGSEIVRAGIYFNGAAAYGQAGASYFSFSSGPVPKMSQVHFRSVMLHELGHAIGFAHINNEYSVMNRTLSNSTERTSLQKVDKDSLKCEYI